MVSKTKKGFEVYNIQLNNSFWATQLLPMRSREKKYNEFYRLYKENNNKLDFLIGKYLALSLSKNNYGIVFSGVYSVDALNDFKQELVLADGKSFSTRLPIYNFLIEQGRDIECDGSIKLKSSLCDMRMVKVDNINICYQHKADDKYLTLKNINIIFDRFFKGVKFESPSYSGFDSYYEIDYTSAAIVLMEHHVKVSYRMTKSGDYDRWDKKIILLIGDPLDEEHVKFLRSIVQ